MNKNSLRQLIVAEMILADINGGGHVSPKKRSLLEMMDDCYLVELEDGRFAHSMESVGNLFEEVPTGDWEVKDRKTGKMRIPGTLLPRTPAQIASTARDAAARAKTKAEKAAAEASAAASAEPVAAEVKPAEASAAASAEPVAAEVKPAAEAEPVAAEVEPAGSNKQDNDPSGPNINPDDLPEPGQIGSGGDSDGEDDKYTEADPDTDNPSGGLAYLDGLAQAALNTESGPSTQPVTKESRFSLIDLLYDT